MSCCGLTGTGAMVVTVVVAGLERPPVVTAVMVTW